MTIISIKSGAEGEPQRIELSGGSFFSFKTCYLPPVFVNEDLYTPGTAEGRQISAEEKDALGFASACLRAEKAALQLIARAEQSVFGLTRKLKKRRHNPACVSAVIARLCEMELVDDRRYARLWLETKISRQATSPWRLLTALRSRGIDRADADSVLKEMLDEETEFRLLERYAEKLARKSNRRRAEETAGQDSEEAAHRALKYQLKGEGFSSSVIERYFDEWE